MRTYLAFAAAAFVTLAPLALPVGLGTSPAAAATASCSTAGRSDFNGDGFDDAAVGDPFGNGDAGSVTVLYGGSDGVIGSAGGDRLTQDDMPLSGEGSEPADQFGYAIATGHVDTDGCLDLVIGVPGEDEAAGAVHVVYGAVGGLGTGKATEGFNQGGAGGDVTEAGDQFGISLAVAPLMGADQAVIAIGAPGDDVGGHPDAGVVSLALAADGFGDGLAVSQESGGVPGGAEEGDRFGDAVALGSLGGSAQHWDLVAGAAQEDIDAAQNAGSITVVNDAARGLEPYTALARNQDSAGVPGAVEAGDRFGHALSALQVGTTRHLAVAVRNEGIGDQANAGMVQLFTSAGAGLTPGAGFHQDTAGVTGIAESGDHFGHTLSLAAPAVTGGGVRLAVGVWQEDIGTVVDAGAVQVFPWADLDAEASYDQNSPDIATVPDENELFGQAVANAGGTSEGVLLVGVPNELTHIGGIVQVIPYAGTPRLWRPGAGGVPAGGFAFGWAVAGQPG
jgi:hypothetical protein